MRWWVWLALVASGLFSPYIIHAVVAFLALSLGVANIRPATAPTEAFAALGTPLEPNRFVSAISQNSGALFWEVMNDSFTWWWPVVLPAIACAGILAADRKTGALQVYLARPVSRIDYLAGKVLAVTAFFGLVHTAPALLLWIECAALQTSFEFIAATWYVPLSIVSSSALYALWVSAVILFFSSLLSRPLVAGISAIFTYGILQGLGTTLAEALEDKWWSWIMPSRAIGAVTAPFFFLGLPDWVPAELCAAHAFGVPLLAYWFVVRRLRAVEVVT
jgi:ABC-type transport system involved in multi-copper enzyme maturation permease subunit